MSLSEEFHTATQTIAERVGPATVRIGRDGGRGVGVVTGDGFVVTNAHNLRGPAVTVTFAEGRVATGEVRGVDADGDLAVIAVDTSGTPAITWGEGDQTVGTPVWAVARSAFGGIRVTRGEVSTVGQPFRGPGGSVIAGSIEHTAPLARGSSGGPLVNADGQVVGLNTHRLGDGFYLALPADAELRRRIDALGEGRSPTRRRLGVALAPARAAQRLRAAVGLEPHDGLLVQGVEQDGPGAAAGLRRGDLIVAAGGRPIVRPEDLYAALSAAGADQTGSTLSVQVLRGAEELTLEVHFPASDEAPGSTDPAPGGE
jgi:S1-C subfamily serine protease